MTPAERAMELWKQTGYFAGLSTDALADAFRAALRERDAAHEVALKKARAVVKLARKLMPYINHLGKDGEAVCNDLRALLEEAGKK